MEIRDITGLLFIVFISLLLFLGRKRRYNVGADREANGKGLGMVISEKQMKLKQVSIVELGE